MNQATLEDLFHCAKCKTNVQVKREMLVRKTEQPEAIFRCVICKQRNGEAEGVRRYEIEKWTKDEHATIRKINGRTKKLKKAEGEQRAQILREIDELRKELIGGYDNG